MSNYIKNINFDDTAMLERLDKIIDLLERQCGASVPEYEDIQKMRDSKEVSLCHM